MGVFNNLISSLSAPLQNNKILLFLSLRITVDRFLAELNSAPFTVTVRWSHGTDINAGCGQLSVMEGAVN